MRFEPNKVPPVEYAVWQILMGSGWSWDYQGGRIQYAREMTDTYMEAWEAVEDMLRDERERTPPGAWTWEREALERLLAEGHAYLEGEQSLPSPSKDDQAHG